MILLAEKKASAINNMEVNKKAGFVLVSLNPKIYPLDIVYSAAYAMIDKVWVIIDGHPEEEIFVELKPKQKMSLEELGRLFNEELLNYAFYKTMAQQNKEVREAIIKRAFLTNTQEMQPSQDIRKTEAEREELSYMDDQVDERGESLSTTAEREELSYMDDPLGIAKPWTPDKAPKEGKKATRCSL